MNNINVDQKLLAKILGGIIIAGGFIYGYVFQFWLPISKKILDIKKNTERIESEIKEAEEKMSKYGDLNKTREELSQQKINLEKKIPKEQNMPDLIKSVKIIADKYSVKIISVSPANVAKGDFFSRITYNMSITGSYHDIGRFFSEIAIQERILNIENVLIPGGETSNVNFVLVSYQSL
ncbi:MAG: type 4a pilus biogenesis protein PilO [Elusimicrobiota bacterium]